MAAVVLMSAETAKELGLKLLAKILCYEKVLPSLFGASNVGPHSMADFFQERFL